MAKTMEHLSEFVFINVASMTLARRDAYLAVVKAGIKQDTLSALRQAPVHLDKLFPDRILKRKKRTLPSMKIKVAQHNLQPITEKTVSTLTKDQRSSKPGP